MGKYCTNCGSEVKPEDKICLSCGIALPVERAQVKNNNAKEENERILAITAIVLAALGFTPILAILGSIGGMVVAIIGLNHKDSVHHKKFKLALILSIISLLIWIVMFVFAMLLLLEQTQPWN